MRYLWPHLFRKLFLAKSACLKFSKLNRKTWSIVFFGSDQYSLYSFTALHEQMKKLSISHMEVVVLNERSPLYSYAVSNAIKTHIWPPDLNGTYDFGVVISFGKLIPKNIIEKFPLGIINVHASLLPKYRGGMPIIHALKNGDTVTGVTVTKIKADKFDIGDIILQKSCLIGADEVMPSLYKRLMELGCECFLEVIKNLPKCLDNCFPQPAEDVSYAPKLTKEFALVKWGEMTASEIFNLHRALFGTYELTTLWNEKPVKFVCMFLSDSNPFLSTKQEPGSFTYSKKTQLLYVQCRDRPVTVCTFKFCGKMHNASSFYNGFLHKVPESQWIFKS